MIARSRSLVDLPRLGIFAVVAIGLLACAPKREEYVERPVEELYNLAMDELHAANYVSAGKKFEEVERQHPYSVWAVKAQLMAAYASYQINKFDDAILAAQRFIQLYPANRDVAYAYYLVALSYYEQISDVGRDQKMTDLALSALDEVIRRFPTSEYARDARLKVDLARDHLAGKEMEIGRFYLKRGLHVGAINRFRRVIESYQTTTHVPEALHRLAEAYAGLGVIEEARAAAAVLGYNYPGSEWYLESYRLLSNLGQRPQVDDQSWMTRLFASDAKGR
ncbi:MAG: outer membrane protein assembly factor BamD [Alphaproteobacteria bacterium]|nr:outer membrane protein assembly factor BamD [Alphaproteobacteria bacterium]